MSSNRSNISKIKYYKKLYYNLVPFRYRYGKEFISSFNFLMESSKWDLKKLKDYQNNEFLKIVNHCFKNVPYYQELFADYGLTNKDISSLDDIKKIPTLNKKQILENFEKLQAINYKNLKKYEFSTSGSTGKKLKFLGTDDVFKKEAAFVLRYYKNTGATMYDKPSVWLRRYVPKDSKSPLWYYDYELKRLYLSAYHINENTITEYFRKINSLEASTMVAYPSSVYILALLAKKKNLKFKSINQVRVASEKVQDNWVSEVESVFNVKMLSHYGQIEKVSFMHQEESNGNYIDNLEYGVTEFVKNDNGQNRIIGTGFLNYSMPFLRYETDDLVKTELKNGQKTVSDIEGRLSDILISNEGSMLPGVNFFSWIDKNLKGIGMFQIIQRINKDIEFHYVPKNNQTIDKKIIIDGLKQRLGEVEVKVIIKEEIKRETSTGKIKLIKNEIQI